MPWTLLRTSALTRPVHRTQRAAQLLNLTFIGIFLTLSQFQRLQNFFHIVQGLFKRFDDLIDFVDRALKRHRLSRLEWRRRLLRRGNERSARLRRRPGPIPISIPKPIAIAISVAVPIPPAVWKLVPASIPFPIAIPDRSYLRLRGFARNRFAGGFSKVRNCGLGFWLVFSNESIFPVQRLLMSGSSHFFVLVRWIIPFGFVFLIQGLLSKNRFTRLLVIPFESSGRSGSVGLGSRLHRSRFGIWVGFVGSRLGLGSRLRLPATTAATRSPSPSRSPPTPP